MYKFAIIILLLLTTAPAVAQDDDTLGSEDTDNLDLFDNDEERTEQGWVQFYASLGATFLDADGALTARFPDGDNVTILNFERAGLDESDTSHWLSLNWRSAHSRWGVWFGAWEYDVSGSKIWEYDFEIPERPTIPAGASVTSEFDADWYILEATYSFFRSDTVDTGIGLGFHIVDLQTTLTAQIEVGDESAEVVSEELDTLAPLPNVLAYLHWKFAPRWSLVGRFGWFGLDYKDYSGKMTNAHAMVNYDLSRRWALGLGYQFVDLDLKVDETDYIMDYSIDFSGPMTYLRFHF